MEYVVYYKHCKTLYLLHRIHKEKVFYKSFIDSKGLLHRVSIEIDTNNRLIYKTSHEVDNNRMEQ